MSSALRLFVDVGDSSTKFALQKEGNVLALGAKKVKEGLEWDTGLQEILKEVKESHGVPSFVIVSFLSSMFRAELLSYTFARSKPELQITQKEVSTKERTVRGKATEEIMERSSSALGIVPEEFMGGALSVLKRSLDGYPVRQFQGLKGREMEFKVLATVLPKAMLNRLSRILGEGGVKRFHLVHSAEGSNGFFQKRKESAISVEVGNHMSRIGVWKEGEFLLFEQIEWGGDILTHLLAESLGMHENSAEELKARYTAGDFTPGMREKVRGLVLPEILQWSTLVRERLQAKSLVLPPRVLLMGGASVLPEIGEALVADFEELPFPGDPEISFLTPKDLGKTGFPQEKDPAYTSLFLLAHGTEQ
ncbi:hypothetical protein KKI17_01655 [Patescibacteria group bacterium]|nr:hypothetical protein [Patescibacteria group bacterium]